MKKLLLTTAALAALAVAAPAANAATGTGLVSGTVLGTITVVATGGTFGPNLAPGSTTNSLASDNVIVTNTSGGWTLTAGDASATTPGQMDADPVLSGGTLCTGSEASLQQPLHLKAGAGTSILGGTFALGTGAANFALPANTSPFTVATLTGSAGLGGTATVPITYSQAIGAAEQVNAGCIYDLTTTYTATGS